MAIDSDAGTRVDIAALDSFPSGSSRVVEVRGRSIGVFNDRGRLYALRNACPHHGAPLCLGPVSGVMRPTAAHVYDYSGEEQADRVLRCPWHGFEFRLQTGRSVTDPERMRVRTYPVEIEDGRVVLYVR